MAREEGMEEARAEMHVQCSLTLGMLAAKARVYESRSRRRLRRAESKTDSGREKAWKRSKEMQIMIMDVR